MGAQMAKWIPNSVIFNAHTATVLGADMIMWYQRTNYTNRALVAAELDDQQVNALQDPRKKVEILSTALLWSPNEQK